jgi:hypothetical protein
MISVRNGLAIRKITNDKARIAVSTAGAIPYFSERFAIDMMGKNDKIVAREESKVLPVDRDFMGFRPGHTKWNMIRSITEMRPDVIEVSQWFWAQAKPRLPRYYKPVSLSPGRIDMYVSERSPNILWPRLRPSGLKNGAR